MGKAYWPSTIYLREHAFSVVPCFISQVTICVWDFLQFQPNIRVMSGLFFIDCIFPWEWATFSWYLCMLSSYEFRMLNTMNATKNLGNKSSMLHDLEKHLSSAPHIISFLDLIFFKQIQSPEQLFPNSETWINSGRDHPKQHGKSSLSHTGVFPYSLPPLASLSSLPTSPPLFNKPSVRTSWSSVPHSTLWQLGSGRVRIQIQTAWLLTPGWPLATL